MKLSKLGFKSIKLTELDSMYPGQDILMKTNQIKQFGSGCYAYDNIPLRVQNKIEEIIKRNFDNADYTEVRMPLIQKNELWQRSNRYQQYIDEGVMLTTKSQKDEYCLAPTAEEAVTAFIENSITSHKQLPVGFYQIGHKFRNEIRNRGYLLRGKEFIMLDLYTFDKNEAEMMKSYQNIRSVYFDIFKEIGLNLIAVAADNGAIGGNRSEEMMVISPLGEDTILYNESQNIGLNIEVLEKENANEYLKENYGIDNINSFKKEKALELGHIFALGQKYSEAMNIKYINNHNKEEAFSMGCYGIGVSRVLGLVYEHNVLIEDEKVVGFALPVNLSPYLTYIIATENRIDEALELYNELKKKNINVILDDTKGSIGEKIRNAKVLGIPYITILGNKSENIELEFTKTKEKQILNHNDYLTVCEDIERRK